MMMILGRAQAIALDRLQDAIINEYSLAFLKTLSSLGNRRVRKDAKDTMSHVS